MDGSSAVRRGSSRPISWQETRERLRQDRQRLREILGARCGADAGATFAAMSYGCVLLHRVAHYLYSRGHTRISRVAWQLNLLLTGADIGPQSEIGGGLVILHPVGVSLSGNVGRNLTVVALCGLGTGVTMNDIGAGPGLPVVGDDVEVGALSGILGAVRVGSRVRLNPGSLVMRDVPDDSDVYAPAARVMARVS